MSLCWAYTFTMGRVALAALIPVNYFEEFRNAPAALVALQTRRSQKV
jgi:hypothetical protein